METILVYDLGVFALLLIVIMLTIISNLLLFAGKGLKLIPLLVLSEYGLEHGYYQKIFLYNQYQYDDSNDVHHIHSLFAIKLISRTKNHQNNSR